MTYPHAPLLSLKDVSINVRGTSKYLTKNISVDLYKGKVTAIVGESGSGKTITSMSIPRLLSPALEVVSGECLYKGQDLYQLSEAELIKKEFGVLGSPNMPLLRDVAVFAARRVIDEVIHIRSRFETRYTTMCTEIWLTGGGARTKGLQELFAQELGLEIKISRAFERVEIPKTLEENLLDISPSFSHAVGLAMSRLI